MCGDQTTFRDADEGVAVAADSVDLDACILGMSTLRGAANANLALFSFEEERGGVRRVIVVAVVVELVVGENKKPSGRRA